VTVALGQTHGRPLSGADNARSEPMAQQEAWVGLGWASLTCSTAPANGTSAKTHRAPRGPCAVASRCSRPTERPRRDPATVLIDCWDIAQWFVRHDCKHVTA